MKTTASIQTQRQRIHWLDNLRTITIFLVILYHVGGVYEASDLWGSFWIVDDPDTITWVGIVGIMFDIMVMPIMFFISGYFSPGSLDRTPLWEFIIKKFKRLMIPWLIAVMTLIPIYKAIFLYSRNLPQEPWYTYFHVNNPNSQNWLWFLPVLFSFDVIYAILAKSNLKFPRISFKAAVWVVFIAGMLSSFFIGGMVGFRTWTLTPIIDFENERLLLYFMMFLLGVLSYRENIFSELPKSQKLYIIASSIAWVPVTVHIFVRVFPFFSPEGFEITATFQLIYWVRFYSSLVVLVYTMVETFWRYFNKTGPVWGELNRNSYGVYIIHVIVIGIFGTLLLNLEIPALVKYLLLILLTYVGSNLIVSGYRRLRKTIQIHMFPKLGG